ncbi:MAG: ArsR family transcriptional regulator [Candidatus Thorarchaeota archaeon]|nr:ArsR family transcriptional regulator [Candidatus Thorarchaeota archaeon]
MPEGLAVLKWDDELGPVVTAKTPSKLKTGLDPTTSMRVYGIATLGETEESQKPGFNSLTFEEFKLAVYYGGLNMHLKGLPSMVFLVLAPEEEPDVYKDALPEIATQIFLSAEDDSYKKAVPKLYRQIERYTQMTVEQRQASILSDPVRRAILQTLMKNGTVQSDDLEQVVFEEVGKKIDMDMVLRPLVKMGIIATGWVEGLGSEVVYLTRAIFILRQISRETSRAVKTGKIPKEVGQYFHDQSKRYHRDYIAKLRRDINRTVWDDAEVLAKQILDFEAYDIIQILRGGPKDSDTLPDVLEMKKKDIQSKLKELERANIVILANDEEGCEHAMLKCNPEVITVYPEWLIQRTVDLYNDEEIVGRQAAHYLEVLKQSHPSTTAGAAMGGVE